MRWTVAFPEAESSTSLDPLNSEYLLVENAFLEARRDLDLDTAPRGVCVNKPPAVRARPRRFGSSGDATVEEVAAAPGEDGEAFTLRGSVSDEGLPRDGELRVEWRRISGPSEVRFADPSSPETAVDFGAPGSYELELWASDGELEATDRVKVRADGP